MSARFKYDKSKHFVSIMKARMEKENVAKKDGPLEQRIEFEEGIEEEKKKVVFPVECSICLEKVENEQKEQINECQHVFHKDCIAKWLKHSSTCPNCRTEVALNNALGSSLDTFARKFDGKTIEDLFIALFRRISAAYEKAEPKNNFFSFQYSIWRMSFLLCAETSLKKSVKKVIESISRKGHGLKSNYHVFDNHNKWERMIQVLSLQLNE